MEQAVAQKATGEHVWTDTLRRDSRLAQDALRHAEAITVPRPSDQLVITCDDAVHNRGNGFILYAVRKNERIITGYFSLKHIQPGEMATV